MRMDINAMNDAFDSFREGTKEIAEIAHTKTKEFHENYISKVLPDCGKYGDAVKFAAEMLPGVSEYNAIRDGDWKSFAISAGIDAAGIALGSFSVGAGYAAVKGGSTGAKKSLKVAVKEISEAGTKKIAKETVEAGTEIAIKETVGAGTEKIAKEVVETSNEKIIKVTSEIGTDKIEKTVESVVEKIEGRGGKKVVLEVGEKIDKMLFPKYIDEVEKITKRKLTRKQKNLLEKTLSENDFCKLDKESWELAVKEFRSKKSSLILEWENMTDQEWPRYTEDVINGKNIVVRKAGDLYDAHHIIELNAGGPNEWWNLHPAKFPDEHQSKIHAENGFAVKIFGH